jgi:hypothetical protein
MYRLSPIALVILLMTSSCARVGGAPADPDRAFRDRAEVVARAWRATLDGPAGEAWRTGLVPLQDLTLPPVGTLGDDLGYAFASGWFRAGVALPDDVPSPATVSFPDGASLAVPLLSARAAFTDMRRGEPPCTSSAGPVAGASPTGRPAPTGSAPGGSTGAPAQHTCAVLTVTAARLGVAALRTSRGTTTVPAWLFTVAELAQPVARVAVAPQAVSPLPRPDVPAMEPALGEVVAGASRLTDVAGTRLTVTIGTGACQHGPRGLAYEADRLVVVGGRAGPAAGGPCPGSLALQPVEVALAAPLGDRVVLDVVTGRPLVLTRSPY